MGGYNSGRYGWRGVIESQRRLDVRELRRQGQLSARPNERPVALTVRHTADAEPVDILVTRVPCRFGGWRHYFQCPRCCRRCEVLILANARTWGCRRCLRLRYVSQGLVPADRLQRRADRLYARAGVEDDEGMIHKHKWLRWRTFNRLMDQANELAGASDAFFALRVMRRFGDRAG